MVYALERIDWREKYGIEDNPKDGDNADKLLAGIAVQCSRLQKFASDHRGEIEKICVSTKGPLTGKGSGTIIGECTTLPFHSYHFVEKLREALMDVGVPDHPIEVLLDGSAAVLGEAAALRRVGDVVFDMAAAILGSGIGLGVLRDGCIDEGFAWNEPRNDPKDDLRRNLGSLGRHLVRDCDGKYKHLGIPLGKQKAKLEAGELHFSERVGGPWLAHLVAQSLLDSGSESSMATMLPRADVERFRKGKQGDRNGKEMEKLILQSLTEAACANDSWAIQQIRQIGEEIGLALAALIATFKDSKWVQHIVLVSTLSEKLGKGVEGETTDDLLVERIRKTVEDNLRLRRLTPENSSNLAMGIRRSVLNDERELLAFM
ncbi:MAG: ROK family protein [Planctomycetaceae bacterium]|nr:ROK family protein [Planctomycetaceae bacterium]